MVQSHNVAKSGATCLACIPLRLGVLLSGVFTIALSILAIWMKEERAVLARMMFGGYTLLSTKLGQICDYMGVFWGIWAIVGAWQLKESYLQVYNYYNFFRVACWVYVIYADYPLIYNCEEWALDLDNAVKRNGWNPAMYKVGMSGACVPTRFYFQVFISIGLVFFVYLIWVNIQLQRLISFEPSYLLRLPAVKLDPAYYAYSMGEKASLLGQRTEVRSDLPPERYKKKKEAEKTTSGTERSAHAASAEHRV